MQTFGDFLNHQVISKSGWKADENQSSAIYVNNVVSHEISGSLSSARVRYLNYISTEAQKKSSYQERYQAMADKVTIANKNEQWLSNSLNLLRDNLQVIKDECREIKSDLSAVQNEYHAQKLSN